MNYPPQTAPGIWMTSTTGDVRGVDSVVLAFPGQGADPRAVVRALETHRYDHLVVRLAEQFAIDDWPSADLTDPRLAQPATFVASTVRARRVRDRVSIALGHSLGELAAVVFADAIDEDAALHLAIARGRICSDVQNSVEGEMLAVLGLTDSVVEGIRRQAIYSSGGVLDIAAVNAHTQLVLSGERPAVEVASRLAKAAGGYALRLPVHGAFHSRLLAPAVPAFEDVLARTPFKSPALPWHSTIDGRIHNDPPSIRAALKDALIRPVRWARTLSVVMAKCPRTIVDVGPDDVLARLPYRGPGRVVPIDSWYGR